MPTSGGVEEDPAAYEGDEISIWNAHEEWHPNPDQPLAHPLPQVPFPPEGDAQEQSTTFVTLQSGMEAAGAAERAARLEQEATILINHVTAITTHGELPLPHQPPVTQNRDNAHGIHPSFDPAVPLGFNVNGYHPLPGSALTSEEQLEAYDVGEIQEELPEFDYGNVDPVLRPNALDVPVTQDSNNTEAPPDFDYRNIDPSLREPASLQNAISIPVPPHANGAHDIVDGSGRNKTFDNFRAPPFDRPQPEDAETLAQKAKLEAKRLIADVLAIQAEEQRTRQVSNEATSSAVSSPPQKDSRVINGNRKASRKVFKASKPKPLATTPSNDAGISRGRSQEEKEERSRLETTVARLLYDPNYRS